MFGHANFIMLVYVYSMEGIMDKLTSILDQYNKSGRKEKVLKELQTKFLQDGTKVINLNDKQFIIQECPELYKKIINLTRLQIDLNNAINNSPTYLQTLTVNKLLEEELVSTNSVEGIHTDRKSVRTLLAGTNDHLKFYQEQHIVEHYKMMLDNQITFSTPAEISSLYYDFLENYIDEDDIKEMGEHFRANSVNIITGSGKVVHKGLEGESNIHSSIKTILDYLHNNDTDIFIKVAIFHYLWGYIHPFYDGNGRMIRLMTSAILFNEINIASLAISSVILQSQSKYYKAFEDTNSKFNIYDLTSFVDCFLNFIHEALTQTIDMMEQNKARVFKFLDYIDMLPLHPKEEQYLSYIYQTSLTGENLQLNQLQTITNHSAPIVKKYIDSLVQRNYLTINNKVKPNIITLNNTWLQDINISD